MVDGVSDTDNLFATWSAFPRNLPSRNSRCRRAFTPPNTGKASRQVNLAIKSGTNQWHGQAYDYIQNDAFNPKSPLRDARHDYLNALCRKAFLTKNPFLAVHSADHFGFLASTTDPTRLFGSSHMMGGRQTHIPHAKPDTGSDVQGNGLAIFLIGSMRPPDS